MILVMNQSSILRATLLLIRIEIDKEAGLQYICDPIDFINRKPKTK